MHLVTGGSGFVGSIIARRLIERGEAVRVLDLWKSDDLPESVEFVKGDINDQELVNKAMRGVQYVHHIVALVPLAKAGDHFWKVNVDGTATALRAAKAEKVKMFAYMSSSAIFGSPKSLPITLDTPREPFEVYGESKKAAEDLALAAAEEGLPVSVIRPRTVIGNGRLGIFQILFEWIRDGADVYVIGSGDIDYQFIHVEDLADVSIMSCLQEKPGCYNVGTDKFGTLRGALEALCEYAGTGSKVKSLPQGPAIALLKFLDWARLSPLGPWHYMIYHKPYYFDTRHVSEALGWKPRYGNEEMMKAAYDWFLSQYDPSAIAKDASTHRRPVRQKVLRLVKLFS